MTFDASSFAVRVVTTSRSAMTAAYQAATEPVAQNGPNTVE